MEQLLHKLARQLDALDEASLLALWNKYAEIVANFEPSQRWEEAAVVFGLIQTKYWKNQLFNHKLAATSRPDPPAASAPVPQKKEEEEQQKSSSQIGHAELLRFVPRRTSDPKN